MPGRRLAASLLASALAVTAGCTAPPRPPQLVVLVSIDTLRPDHLGAYGYPLPTSPNLDRFRRDAVLFRQAIAHAPSTLPSHASLLTSLLPHHHGASHARQQALPDSAVTLAEVMQGAGYRTIGLVGGGQLAPVFGLGQGFEWYKAPFRGNRDFSPVAKPALRWLDRHPGEPVFLFLHTYQTHHPYTAPAAHRALFDKEYQGSLPATISVDLLRQINDGRRVLDDADRQHIVHAYDAEIHAMDEAFGRFVEGLESRGLYEEALIVVTSDHGEEFGEHGVMGWHSHTLYDELLRVPLLIKLPRALDAGREVTDPVRSIDVAPTILAIAGLAIPDEFAGRSLLPLMRGEAQRPLPAISRRDRTEPSLGSIRHDGHKLWDGRLFDLETDPGEHADVAAADPAAAERLHALLRSAVDARPPLAGREVELGDATRRELRALGYAN